MKGAKIILHAKSPTFRPAKLKGFTVSSEHIWFHLSDIFISLFVHDVNLLLIKSLLMFKHK